MTRRSLASALLWTLVSANAAAQQFQTSHAANARNGPSIRSSIVVAVDSGVVVSLLSEKGGYDRVELADHTRAWIYARFLHATGFAKPASRSSVSTVVADATALVALPKFNPREANDARCGNHGAGKRPESQLDVGTNLLKNRTDEGIYHDVSFAMILSLPWRNLPRSRNKWLPANAREAARYERAAIALTGYVLAVKLQGVETTNCELPAAEWRDWHVWLVETAAEAIARDRSKAVVVEATPRVRDLHPSNWDFKQLESWSRETTRVRVSGWLMLDPEHPDQVGKTRGTTWEIHPVMDMRPAP